MQYSTSLPLWIGFAGLILTAVAIAVFYHRTGMPITRFTRYLLIALRVLAVALILFCILEPTLITRENIQQKPNLLILVDNSQSMSLTDMKSGETDEIPRIEIAKQSIISQESDVVEDLAERFNLHFYQFDSDCISVETPAFSADGNLTDMGKAISKAANDWRGQLNAGILMLSDGGNNSGPEPLTAVKQVGLPVYTLGIGNTEMPRDIQVSKVDVTPIAYVDHILNMQALINSNGYDGQQVQVTLNMGDGTQPGAQVLDSVPLVLDSQTRQQAVELQFKPQQEGTFNFSVKIDSDPEEITAQNNIYPFTVEIVKTKLRVLFLEGTPRWEFAFMRRAIEKDPNIEADFLVTTKAKAYYYLGEDENEVQRFPENREELFSYDVLIIGDINLDFFNSVHLDMINDFVEGKGGSAVFLAGGKSFGPDGFGNSSIQKMMPLELGGSRAIKIKSPFNPALTQEGLRHPVTRISEDQTQNISIWRDLPVLTSFYRTSGVKLGATILAEYTDGATSLPIIAFQRYGNGVVMMITSDNLWRWSFGGYPYGMNDSYYRKFWSGAVRWLASVSTRADLVNVETDKGSYYKGENVKITVYVYDESYTPLSDANLSGKIQMLDETKKINLKLVSEGNGRYTAEFVPAREGRYEVYVKADYAGKNLDEATTEFVIQKAVLEFQDTQLNEGLLKNVAETSGGVYLHVSEVSELPETIKDVDVRPFSSIRERSIWDNWIVMLMAVGMLTAEWILRKRNGMV
ncbi:hypothetical protein GF312_03385 [Candidatus Poribacteria bacterium]|nr:hypothetical protein [Candidatus Poribacteria bacterium]